MLMEQLRSGRKERMYKKHMSVKMLNLCGGSVERIEANATSS